VLTLELVVVRIDSNKGGPDGGMLYVYVLGNDVKSPDSHHVLTY
jgi:hypothetical protein